MTVNIITTFSTNPVLINGEKTLRSLWRWANHSLPVFTHVYDIHSMFLSSFICHRVRLSISQKIAGIRQVDDFNEGQAAIAEAILERSGLITANEASWIQIATALVSPVDYQACNYNYIICDILLFSLKIWRINMYIFFLNFFCRPPVARRRMRSTSVACYTVSTSITLRKEIAVEWPPHLWNTFKR